jgi:hypothetical protein
MSSQSFFRLLNRIFFNPIFRNESYRAQEEIGAQLAITLDRLGHDGNGMSGVQKADFWKRSEGSVINYIGRVVKALLDLQEEYASWPTDEICHAHSQVRKRTGYVNFEVLIGPMGSINDQYDLETSYPSMMPCKKLTHNN